MLLQTQYLQSAHSSCSYKHKYTQIHIQHLTQIHTNTTYKPCTLTNTSIACWFILFILKHITMNTLLSFLYLLSAALHANLLKWIKKCTYYWDSKQSLYYQHNKKQCIHSMHWTINRPLKNATSLFLAKPSLNRQTVQAPPFRQSPSLYWFFVNPPKSQIFQWTPKILKVFILNTILSFKSN